MWMRLSLVLSFIASVLVAGTAVATADTQKIYASPHSLNVTAERFKQAAEAHGLIVKTMMMKAQSAESYGLEVPASIVISFGLPKQDPHGDEKVEVKEEVKEGEGEAPPILPRAVVYTNEDGTVSLAVNTSDASFDGKGAHGHEASGYAETIEEFAKQAVAE